MGKPLKNLRIHFPGLWTFSFSPHFIVNFVPKNVKVDFKFFILLPVLRRGCLKYEGQHGNFFLNYVPSTS